MGRPVLDEDTAKILEGCDLKVLKRSAGGIATRRARPIRFVRVLAAGFAALRAFPSKAALSSAHFRALLIGHLKANPKSKDAGRRQIEAIAPLCATKSPA